jgi:hypothetical protein
VAAKVLGADVGCVRDPGVLLRGVLGADEELGHSASSAKGLADDLGFGGNALASAHFFK